MDALDLALGAAACLGAKAIDNSPGWVLPTEKERIDAEISKRTDLSIPDYAGIEASKSMWSEEGKEVVSKCAVALKALYKEISFMPIEVRYSDFPIRKRTKCFVSTERPGLACRTVLGPRNKPRDIWKLSFISESLFLTVEYGAPSEGAFDCNILETIRKRISEFRTRYWIINTKRYKAWSKKYLESIDRGFKYDLFLRDFNRDPAVWVDNPTNIIVERTPAEIVYFDKVADKIMRVSERMLRAAYDWYMPKCGKMPSDEFLNEHGLLSIGQYAGLKASL